MTRTVSEIMLQDFLSYHSCSETDGHKRHVVITAVPQISSATQFDIALSNNNTEFVLKIKYFSRS